MTEKELYSILNTKGELVGSYWAYRPCKGALKALKQIFKNTNQSKNVIFNLYNRMKKKLYKYRGNIKYEKNTPFKIINGSRIPLLYKYIVERI